MLASKNLATGTLKTQLSGKALFRFRGHAKSKPRLFWRQLVVCGVPMDNNPWGHPTRHIISLLVKNIEVVISVITAVSVVASPYFAGHHIDKTTAAIGFFFLILGAATY